MVDDECRQPGYHSLIDHNKQGISSTTHLPLHSGDSGHAGGVQQGEHEEGQSCCSGQHGGKGGRQVGHRRACQHGQCADHRFFGSETGDQRSRQLPAAKPQGGKQRCDPTADQGQQALAAVCHHIQPGVKGLQSPYDDGGQKDDGKCPGDEVLRFVPHKAQYAFGGGQPVGRQLHDKGHRVAAEQRFAHQ